MNLKSFTNAVLVTLGISKFEEVEGKKVLTEAQKSQLLNECKFSPEFVANFEAALNEPKPNDDASDSHRVAAISAVLGQVTSQLEARTNELNQLKTQATASADQLASKNQEIADLTEKVRMLSALPEVDPGKNATATATASTVEGILADDKQLGGRQGVMFSLSRPYNMRAKAAILSAHGRVLTTSEASSFDYDTLREDLGAFYRQPWLTRVQSFLKELPTIEAIFPLQSGYQDLATLVNIWLGEFSQADNSASSDFDKVSKGSYEFGTETLRMYGVMFSHKFTNMKELEKLWIGSLNKEGSDPIKWSFIEYILIETAKKLHNEREQRRINGVRVDPNPNVPGRALSAADGLYEYIRKKCDGHIDYTPDGGTTGRTVFQIKPFELGEITQANIGEVIYNGTSMVPSEFRDTGSVVLYIPSFMVPWYHKYNEATYGRNQNYNGAEMHVHEFPSVKLIPVPNADNHHRLIWTIEGNIKTFEHQAAEMLNFHLEQQDWSLKVWSNWKESIQAEAVGYKYTDKNLMDGSRQLIWCNEYDRPASYFMDGQPDQNPSVKLHTSVATVANTEEFEITDIADAPEGVAVSIKCGVDGERGVKILKSGKFSLIASNWTPSKGEIITLMKRADGKFIEIERKTAADNSLRFAADDTTPSVANAAVFVTGDNTEATAITNLANAEEGKVYTIYGSGSTNASTIANSGNFVLTAAMTLAAGSFIKLVKGADGKFYEVSRG